MDRWPASEYICNAEAVMDSEKITLHLHHLLRGFLAGEIVRKKPYKSTDLKKVIAACVTTDKPQVVLAENSVSGRIGNTLEEDLHVCNLPRMKQKIKAVQSLPWRESKNLKGVNKSKKHLSPTASVSSNTKREDRRVHFPSLNTEAIRDQICLKKGNTLTFSSSSSDKPVYMSVQKGKGPQTPHSFFGVGGNVPQKETGIVPKIEILSVSSTGSGSSSVALVPEVTKIKKGVTVELANGEIEMKQLEPKKLSATLVSEELESDTLTRDSAKQCHNNSLSSSVSTEMLHPVGKTTILNIISILQAHYGGTVLESYEVLRKNDFNILRTLQELQVLHPEADDKPESGSSGG